MAVVAGAVQAHQTDEAQAFEWSLEAIAAEGLAVGVECREDILADDTVLLPAAPAVGGLFQAAGGGQVHAVLVGAVEQGRDLVALHQRCREAVQLAGAGGVVAPGAQRAEVHGAGQRKPAKVVRGGSGAATLQPRPIS